MYCSAQPVPGSYYDFLDATKDMEVGHPKSKLIIYRPQNNGEINEVRCYLRLLDENENDVTFSACSAKYEWIENHYDTGSSRSLQEIFSSAQQKTNLYDYKKSYFLSGSMAMHLTLKPGKYKILFYTPVDKQNNFSYSIEGTRPYEWKSNIFEYNTENPAKVIFVSPVVNENGFYNGSWFIDSKSPGYFKDTTIPSQQKE